MMLRSVSHGVMEKNLVLHREKGHELDWQHIEREPWPRAAAPFLPVHDHYWDWLGDGSMNRMCNLADFVH
jgi:hypothetical protein